VLYQRKADPVFITINRVLVTQGYLRDVARSDNNPHGFLIEHWKTMVNRSPPQTPIPKIMLSSKHPQKI
jgi:hypothetical protein